MSGAGSGENTPETAKSLPPPALAEGLIGELEAAKSRAAEALSLAVEGDEALADVERVRVAFLGKKGEVSGILKTMGQLKGSDRPRVGKVANAVRDAITQALEKARSQAKEHALLQELAGPSLDVTLPGRQVHLGRRHPVMSTLEDLVATFRRMGFSVADGPEIEGEAYNFEALCIPPEHPARDMQDTLYCDGAQAPVALRADGSQAQAAGRSLLRTHTSPVQIRSMLRTPPPVRIIAPGKVYRRDSDLTHTPMFHQIEGLWVGEGITMAHLKGTLQRFAREFFGPEIKIRLRPSYFPFTEPSAEVDLTCTLCGGAGCRTCSGSGWLEILGAGMVDPGVFESVGYDPERVSGFAFGMGVDRIAMMRHHISDLRALFENDLRFLEAFAR